MLILLLGKDIKYHDAVNDDDESDNEDVPMVTDVCSSSQETSLVAHVHVTVPSQELRDRENDN